MKKKREFCRKTFKRLRFVAASVACGTCKNLISKKGGEAFPRRKKLFCGKPRHVGYRGRDNGDFRTFFERQNRRSGFRENVRARRRVCRIHVLGVFVGVANNLNLYLSGALKSAVTFPVTNGGTIALSAVGSALFFREKLGFNKVAGIILGIVAIVLIARGG